MLRRIDPAGALAKIRSYQLEIYENGMFSNISPRVTTDTVRLEEEARKHVEARAFNYGETKVWCPCSRCHGADSGKVAGGAGERATQHDNRAAFRRWQVFSHLTICDGLAEG